MMFSFAWRWSSLTHALALSSELCSVSAAASCLILSYTPRVPPYRLCDVVYDYGAVRIPIVHGRQRLVAFLPCCVPYLKLDRRLLVEGDSLCQEGCADGGFSVVVELILILS
jgi:hypothetical protein